MYNISGGTSYDKALNTLSPAELEVQWQKQYIKINNIVKTIQFECTLINPNIPIYFDDKKLQVSENRILFHSQLISNDLQYSVFKGLSSLGQFDNIKETKAYDVMLWSSEQKDHDEVINAYYEKLNNQ